MRIKLRIAWEPGRVEDTWVKSDSDLNFFKLYHQAEVISDCWTTEEIRERVNVYLDSFGDGDCCNLRNDPTSR